MISRINPRIESAFGNHLVETGILTQNFLDSALEKSKDNKESLIELLCQDYGMNDKKLYELLSRHLGIPYQSLKQYEIPRDVVQRIQIKIVHHYQLAPLCIKGNTLTLAAHYQIDVKTQDELKLHLGLNIQQVLSTRSEIEDIIKRSYGMAASTVDRIVSGSYSKSTDLEDLDISSISTSHEMASDSSVINLVNEIILEAYKRRATDIHLEPYRGHFRLRYRIDGVLHDANLSQQAKSLIQPIISRIKIMSNLDIVEHRLPQDGRSIVQVGKQRLDLRISCIPTPSGESIVIRVLKTEMIFDLNALGIAGEDTELINKLIRQPFGMILLTGPTGSGKTTTLYACMNKIQSDERKIITLEDPIEYEIPGITQIQIKPKVGLGFAEGLRSVLRHDPDIMMVGEIRDLETAEIAVRSALTGHLIFSTLHTNDATSGIARLMDIGVEPFLVASSLSAIVAQRLVRVICTSCKEQCLTETNEMKKKIASDCGLNSLNDVMTWSGKGCDLCNHTGYLGRTAIHEILVLTEPVKELILKKASIRDIKQIAIEEGMRTLLTAGWRAVLKGITTTSEVMNVASVGVI